MVDLFPIWLVDQKAFSFTLLFQGSAKCGFVSLYMPNTSNARVVRSPTGGQNSFDYRSTISVPFLFLSIYKDSLQQFSTYPIIIESRTRRNNLQLAKFCVIHSLDRSLTRRHPDVVISWLLKLTEMCNSGWKRG